MDSSIPPQTRHQSSQAASERRITSKDVWLLVIGAILGAIIGFGFNFLTPAATSAYDEAVCHATCRLTEAQRINREARTLLAGGDREAANRMFAQANVLFAQLDECGIAGGSAQLGLNKCHGFGFGLERNEPEGIVLLRRAAARDAFFRDWVDDRTICFGVKGVQPPPKKQGAP
jgi:hypothetical protein